MFRYAQINNEGVCFAISDLSGEVIAPDMIRLDESDDVKLGDTYQDGQWIRPEPEPEFPA